jgi:hypothetical protein
MQEEPDFVDKSADVSIIAGSTDVDHPFVSGLVIIITLLHGYVSDGNNKNGIKMNNW